MKPEPIENCVKNLAELIARVRDYISERTFGPAAKLIVSELETQCLCFEGWDVKARNTAEYAFALSHLSIAATLINSTFVQLKAIEMLEARG